MRATDMTALTARLAPWIVAVALACVATTLASRLAVLRTENASLHTERMLAEVAYKLGQTQLAERTLRKPRGSFVTPWM